MKNETSIFWKIVNIIFCVGIIGLLTSVVGSLLWYYFIFNPIF